MPQHNSEYEYENQRMSRSMKTKNKRAPEMELFHFCDGSAALTYAT